MTLTDAQYDDLLDRCLDGDEDAIAEMEELDGVAWDADPEPREDFGFFGVAGAWD